MKQYEKILLFIFGVSFLLQLLVIPGDRVLFALSTWLLCLSYLIGGYWLFKAKENKKAISIISGIALASSLFNLPFLIRINKVDYDYFLPVANGLLFVFLLGYLFLYRKAKTDLQNIKLLVVRSLVILIITSFFTYTSINFKPYRSILYALNNGHDYIQNNLRMFDYVEECDDALDKGECDRAIQNGLKANEEGKAWLGISIEDSLNDNNELWKVSGTYSRLYNAYKCKADDYFNKEEYELALNYYLKSESSLNKYQRKSEYWKIQQIYSKNSLALCYRELNNYEFADSLFAEAINQYEFIKDTIDSEAAVFYSNYGKSMSNQGEIEYSNLLFKSAIRILERDTINRNNKKGIIKNYRALIKNNFRTDSLKQAKLYIDKTYKLVNKSTINFCNINLYYGIYLYKINKYTQANNVYTECLECYNKFLEPTNQNIAKNNLLLAQAKIALAQYDKARTSLNKGIDITIKNYGKNSERFANYLKIDAQLDKIQGKYQESETKYFQVLESYTNAIGEDNWKMSAILSSLADLELILAKFNQAKTHSNASLSISKQFVDLESPSITNLLNNAAYVNYYIGKYKRSDSLYRKTIDINKTFNLENSASSAIALNGLGLLMTSKKEYKKADSLFTKTLKLHKEIFTEKHPFTAIVYLNYGNLKLDQKRLKEAEKMLTKSINTNKKFFNPKHDIFADTYMAYGNLYIKENQFETAKEYYLKALDIYLGKFEANHIKVITVKDELKRFN
ncbi:tetratricopeptide repeat protein [Lacinutrix jangbogonensis]|uniref:tetratricopeptide repeat protein n=1 Tax=Lacinutrix jangbogonensis TaxID=1469557 RepID=UPI00053DD10F|nr:tetratricopeptide repeat protein [Lacinutrix jangbogonensis]